MLNSNLFNNYKQCEYCGTPLSPEYQDTICPSCKERTLFQRVKEFIRANDVNEYEVAYHFHIPLRQVKEWIKEGRIEYKEQTSKTLIESLHCQRCGAPITFGTLCSKCLKHQNVGKGHAAGKPADNKMYYLDK